jgi:hypothetical protein
VAFAASVLVLAGLGIFAFGLSFAVRVAVDPSAGRIGVPFFILWAIFFVAGGALHIFAAVGAARGRRWALWLGTFIGLGGAVLGCWTLLVVLSHITGQMDVPGTIGLALVSGLYAIAGWSLVRQLGMP